PRHVARQVWSAGDARGKQIFRVDKSLQVADKTGNWTTENCDVIGLLDLGVVDRESETRNGTRRQNDPSRLALRVLGFQIRIATALLLEQTDRRIAPEWVGNTRPEIKRRDRSRSQLVNRRR